MCMVPILLAVLLFISNATKLKHVVLYLQLICFLRRNYYIQFSLLVNTVMVKALYPSACQHERAKRLDVSQRGIRYALKRLGISQKKSASKSKS